MSTFTEKLGERPMPEGRMKEGWRTTVISAVIIIATLLIACETAHLWHHG